MLKMRKFSAIILAALIISSSVLTYEAIWFFVLPKTLVVPDAYISIQHAYNQANAGDTIFFKKGTYQLPPNFEISKTINLVGEDAPNTILLGEPNQSNLASYVTFRVGAPDVLIKGFTFKDCKTAVLVENWGSQSPPVNCKIINNIFFDNAQAIEVGGGPNFEITGNIIARNQRGISVSSGSPTGIISSNTIIQNGEGISIASSDITVENNIVSNNSDGLSLLKTGPYSIYDNTISDNSIFGVSYGPGVSNSILHNNEISNNVVGFKFENFPISGDTSIGYGNQIYGNNIVNNEQNVIEKSNLHKSANGNDIVSWDNGISGNYWRAYSGFGSYTIDEDIIDHHPLIIPVWVGGSSALLVLVLVVTLILALFVFYKRQLRRSPPAVKGL